MIAMRERDRKKKPIPLEVFLISHSYYQSFVVLYPVVVSKLLSVISCRYYQPVSLLSPAGITSLFSVVSCRYYRPVLCYLLQVLPAFPGCLSAGGDRPDPWSAGVR